MLFENALKPVCHGAAQFVLYKSMVGYFGFNGHLRQYFSLYRAVSQREGERGDRIDESKNVQTTPTRTYCKHNRPLPYCYQNCRTPRHWKFTQHHRATRPSPLYKSNLTEPCYKLPVQYICECDIGTVIQHSTM